MPCTLSQEQIDQTISFHGHWCPGLAYGIRAAEWALTNLGDRSTDEELVAVVETDMCAVDAIQVLTGCTFGKGNLIHKDYGKSAFTFYRRSDGRGSRLVTRPRQDRAVHDEMTDLHQKSQAGTLTGTEAGRLAEMRAQTAAWLMGAPIEDIFDIQPPKESLPRPARIMKSVICADCGEATMETRLRRSGEFSLCIPCFDQRSAPA